MEGAFFCHALFRGGELAKASHFTRRIVLPQLCRPLADHMKRHVNKFALVVLILVLGVRPILGKDASLTQAEIKDGWILLFDGESVFGLSQDGQLTWRISDGALLADGSGPGYIRTNSPFSDFVLKMDVRLANSASDAALYIRTAKDGFPTDNGYQIPIGDGNPNWPAGSVVPRFKAKPMHPQAGQWHSWEITADGDHVTVLLDQKTVVEAKDSSVRAGYIGFKVGSGAVLEVRNIKLKPINTVALFNGSDLGGWKTLTPPPPTEKPSKLKKIFPFGGGGKPKIKESIWSVQGGTIHGEKGPGQLDTVATYDDFILQFAVPTSTKKPQTRRTIYVRSDTGKIFTGYEISLSPDQPGAIAPNLATPRKVVPIKDLAIGTVAVSGRHVEVWINGFPVTEFNDTRPEGASTTQNARTTAGAIGLPLHDASGTADYTQIRLTTVAKVLGGVIGKPLPATPPAVASGTPAVSAPVMAVNPEAQHEAENRKKTAKLMSDALKSTDPDEQMRLYDQVIQLDPTNSAAASGYKEAKEKVDKRAEENQKQTILQTQQQQNQSAGEAALHKAQFAFFAGDLTTADSQLALAERLTPNNPVVRGLRQKLDAVRAQNSRLRYLFFGGGLLAFGGFSTLFWLRLRRKHGFLEVVSGIEKGRRYNLDQEVVRIGAVAQDGDGKNDIVLRDLQHMISRFHCEVHKENGKFYLLDCNSSNGTCIDKKQVPPEQFTRLKNGSRVELGGAITLLFGLERKKQSPGIDQQRSRNLNPDQPGRQIQMR